MIESFIARYVTVSEKKTKNTVRNINPPKKQKLKNPSSILMFYKLYKIFECFARIYQKYFLRKK